MIQIKEKIPLMEHYNRKYNFWTDRKGGYEATFGMLENKLLGYIKLKKIRELNGNIFSWFKMYKFRM